MIFIPLLVDKNEGFSRSCFAPDPCSTSKWWPPDYPERHGIHHAFLQTCRRLYLEFGHFLYTKNVFTLSLTGLPEARFWKTPSFEYLGSNAQFMERWFFRISPLNEHDSAVQSLPCIKSQLRGLCVALNIHKVSVRHLTIQIDEESYGPWASFPLEIKGNTPLTFLDPLMELKIPENRSILIFCPPAEIIESSTRVKLSDYCQYIGDILSTGSTDSVVESGHQTVARSQPGQEPGLKVENPKRLSSAGVWGLRLY